MPAITTIKLRAGIASQWTTANPVLALGEPGLERDTGKLKFGDGATAWASLAYATVAINDSRLSDQRVPTNASVTVAKLATDAVAALAAKAPLASPTLTGVATLNGLALATTADVASALAAFSFEIDGGSAASNYGGATAVDGGGA